MATQPKPTDPGVLEDQFYRLRDRGQFYRENKLGERKHFEYPRYRHHCHLWKACNNRSACYEGVEPCVSCCNFHKANHFTLNENVMHEGQPVDPLSQENLDLVKAFIMAHNILGHDETE